MTEQVIHERADSGRGVILGRAARVCCAIIGAALHVRLDGPCEARLRQAMRLEGIDRDTAEQRMRETDRRRAMPTCASSAAPTRATATSITCVLDSTAIDLDTA